MQADFGCAFTEQLDKGQRRWVPSLFGELSSAWGGEMGGSRWVCGGTHVTQPLAQIGPVTIWASRPIGSTG